MRLFFLCLLAMFVFGCAHRATEPSRFDRTTAEVLEKEGTRPATAVIREANLHLEIPDITAFVKAAEETARKNGGSVENSSISDEDTAVITVHVPTEHLDAALDAFSLLGKVKQRSVSTQDVTGEVIDLDARLLNKLALRDRLKSLLQQAKDVRDVLAVEEQLTRLQSEIDSLEGRMKNLKARTSMAKISIYGERHRILGPLGYVFKGLWWGISKLFVIQ